jgi:hypothetical protein
MISVAAFLTYEVTSTCHQYYFIASARPLVIAPKSMLGIDMHDLEYQQIFRKREFQSVCEGTLTSSLITGKHVADIG